MPFEVYVLACNTPNHFYIGFSANFENRLEQHKNGKGALFTKKHGVSRVLQIENQPSLFTAFVKENLLTMKFIKKYGYKNVGGGDIKKYMRIFPYVEHE